MGVNLHRDTSTLTLDSRVHPRCLCSHSIAKIYHTYGNFLYARFNPRLDMMRYNGTRLRRDFRDELPAKYLPRNALIPCSIIATRTNLGYYGRRAHN